MNSIKFLNLKNYLEDKLIKIDTKLPDDTLISGMGSLECCKNNQLTFFSNDKYKNNLIGINAIGCFITKENAKLLPNTCHPLIVQNPYLAFAISTNFFHPKIKSDGLISDKSIINEKTNMGKNVQINSNVVIKSNCSIGDNCVILDNSLVGPNVKIDANTIVMSNCVISNSLIGKNCNIQSGSIIGDKGFGFIADNKTEIVHIGNVVIGNNVDIGNNTTVDRAALDSTIIEDNVRIDNLVQIAHNVKIGKNSIIAAQTGIAGSTSIGKNCIIGGQVGISGHLNIGNNVKIAAKSGVIKNIKENSIIAGFPAIDIKVWKKNIINERKKLK